MNCWVLSKTVSQILRMEIKSRLAPDDGPSTALLKYMEAFFWQAKKGGILSCFSLFRKELIR